jgi:hypothetical protein
MHPAISPLPIPEQYWKPFDPKLWDAGLYALLALRQYAASPQWTSLVFTDPKLIGWQTDTQFVKDEIAYLRSLMENDRASYMAEIVAQHDNAPFYWFSLLDLTNGSKPATLKLLQMALRIGELTAIYYKDQFKRVRASVIAPGLAPPFGPPGHPSFPSGHSLQGWLMSYCLMHITRPKAGGSSVFKDQLKWLAKRVATNRERAGLHYPSDSLAGKYIASYIFDNYLKVNSNNLYSIFYQALVDAGNEWSF